MTKKQKEIQKKIKALYRLAGMFKVTSANPVENVKDFRFVLKNYWL